MVLMPKKEKEKRTIVLHRASGTTTDGTHYEQIDEKSGLQYYVTYRGGKMQGERKFILEYEDKFQKVYINPIDPRETFPFNLQTRNLRPKEYSSVTKLFEEIYGYLWDHWDYYDPAFYDVATSWVIATYLPEKWDFVAYLAAIGDKGTGKTRFLNCLTALVYRGWKATYFQEAPLFRAITAWHPTVLIDESETMTRKDKNTIQNLLNAGQKRGDTVPRCEEKRYGGTRTYDIKLFSVFGFKALAGTKMWLPTIQRRSFMAFCSTETRKVKRRVDKNWAQELRRKLLQYRIDYIDEEFTETLPQIDKLTEELSGGVYELCFSLFSVTPRKKWDSLMKYANKEEQLRVDERGVTDMAEVFNAMIQIKGANTKIIKLKDIAAYLNRDRIMREMWKARDVGTFVSLLGFKKKHMNSGNVVIWDEKIADRLSKQYGLELTRTKAQARSAPPRSDLSKIMDVKKSE